MKQGQPWPPLLHCREDLYAEPEQFKVEQFLQRIEPQAKEQSARYALKALYTQMLRLKKALIRKALCYTWFVQTGILSPA